jgi:hypothetical protein
MKSLIHHTAHQLSTFQFKVRNKLTYEIPGYGTRSDINKWGRAEQPAVP